MAEQAAVVKKSGIGKKIAIVLFVLFVLVVIGVAIALSQIGTLVKVGVEKGGTYALGTNTTLEKADIGLFSGKVGLTKLNIANPQGFKSPEFFSMGNGQVEVSLGSLSKNVIEVPLIKFDTIRVNLEKKEGASNYNVILENLKKVTGGDKPATDKPMPAEPAGESKKFIVKSIQIRDVKVHVDLLGTGGSADKLAEVNIPIDEVLLSDVGTVENGGVDLQTLASVIVNAVLGAAADKGQNLPPEFLNDLKSQVAGLQAQLDQVKGLKGASTQVIGKAGEDAKKIGNEAKDNVQKALEAGDTEAAKKAAEDAAKKATDTGKKAVDDLKKLFPKKKEEPK